VSSEASNTVRRLCDEAVAEFGALCFWWADRRPGKLDPNTVIKGLRQYGGHAGMRRARAIQEVLRAADGVSGAGSPGDRREPQSG
jgi:hypothetical protein